MKPLSAIGRFATVVIDPPWPVEVNHGLDNGGLNRRNPLDYHTMAIGDICAIPIPDVLDSDAILFCWTTNRFLWDAKSILDAWGVRYAFTMTWIKGGGPQFPNGPMYNSEWVLVGKKGSPQFTDIRSFMTANYWPRGEHSEKPEGFYDLLRRVTPEPRLDIFGRRRIPGFYSWGNEAPEGEPLPGYYQDVLDLTTA